MSTWT